MGISFFPLVMKARFYHRGPDRYIVVLWWKGRPYKRTYYDDSVSLVHEELARQVCSGINADIAQKGKNFDPRQWFRASGKELQFSTYADKWLGDQTHYAPSVQKDVKRYVGLYQVYFGKMDIREIKKGQLDDFLKTLAGYSPKTQRNIFSLLHKIFSDAYKREDILRVPGFPTVSVPEKAPRRIGLDWQGKIIDAIPERDRPIFQFMAIFGVRPGEARALAWEDVDWKEKRITIRKTYSGRTLRDRTKTNRERELPITEEIAAILGPLRGLAGPVFRNKWGKPYSDHLPRIWNEAVDRVGGPEINLYNGTKHTLGCWLVSEGYSIERVRQLFGHTNVNMTRRYAEADTEAIREMVEHRKTIPKPSILKNEAKK